MLFGQIPSIHATVTETPQPKTNLESSTNIENTESAESKDSEEIQESAESKDSEEIQENTESKDSVEIQESSENTEKTESTDEDSKVEIKDEGETKKSEVSEEEQNLKDNELIAPLADGGLANVSILENTELNASMNESGDTISLEFTGRTILDLSLLNGLYVTFVLPDEIDVSLLDDSNLSAEYWDYILIIPIRYQYDDEFIINEELNSISLSFRSILGLDLLGLFPHRSTLEITTNQIISSSDGTLEFKAIGTDGALVDLNVLDGAGFATATIGNVPITPSSPVLQPIYSNTAVIKGTLPEDFESGSTVNVYLSDGTQGTALVNNGSFSFTLEQPLAEGSLVEASITTPEGLASSVVSMEVQQAPPPLIVPETLDFGTVPIGSDVTYKFLEQPLEITVQDTRGTNAQWQIQAHINQPLTAESGHTLPNALGFYEENEFKPFTVNSSGTGNDAIAVKTGTTQNDDATTYRWNPEQREGPVIKIDHSTVYAEPYSTDVTWTLVDDP